MDKCYECLFAGEYHDMGASVPVCNRCEDFEKAVSARETTGPCIWHITTDELIAWQERSIAPPQQNDTDWNGDMCDAY